MILNQKKYEIIKNEKEGFDKEEVESLLTDYFDSYDYILGDWAYGKLRLKGFYKSDNKNKKVYNDYEGIDKYIKDKCAFGCKHFILKKIEK